MKQFLSEFVPFIFPPSFLYTICLALGIIYSASGHSIGLFFLCAFGLMLLCFKFKKNVPLCSLVLLSFLLGATSFYHKKSLFIKSKLELGPCQATILEQSTTGNPHWPHRFRLATKNGFHFFVYTKQWSSLAIGDYIEARNLKIKKPNESDFRNYLFKEGVAGTAFIQFFDPIVIKRPSYSFTRWAYQVTTNALKKLKRKMSRSTFAFFSSLFIGDKKSVKKTIETQAPLFKEWGIAHHLARSGLHLMLFIILWQLLISLLPFSFFLKTALITLLSVFYFILTPWSISFIRAFQLFIFYKLCIILDWQINPINILCVAFLLTLIYNPFQLFFLDFQLSFYCTFCLAWLAHLNRQKRPFLSKTLFGE